jgi:hypothetical protein
MLDTFNARLHPIKPIWLATIIAHAVNCSTNVKQMRKDNVVRLDHGVRLSQHRIIVNYHDDRDHPRDVLPKDQREE